MPRAALLRPGVVGFPEEVRSAGLFDVDRGDALDLTRTRLLTADALPGLVRLVRGGTVQLRLVEDSQPFRTIERHFGVELIPDLVDPQGYLLSIPS